MKIDKLFQMSQNISTLWDLSTKCVKTLKYEVFSPHNVLDMPVVCPWIVRHNHWYILHLLCHKQVHDDDDYTHVGKLKQSQEITRFGHHFALTNQQTCQVFKFCEKAHK